MVETTESRDLSGVERALIDMTGAYHLERAHAGKWDTCQKPRCQNARLALDGRGPFASLRSTSRDSEDPESDDATCGCGAIGVAEHTNAQHYGMSRDSEVREAHKPGEPHRYEIECKDCGQRGVIRLSVDPETAPAAVYIAMRQDVGPAHRWDGQTEPATGKPWRRVKVARCGFLLDFGFGTYQWTGRGTVAVPICERCEPEDFR